MRLFAAIALCLAAACARMMPPPGGPEDRLPPRLTGTRPDSLRSIPDFDGNVEFQFNEVVSEGSQPNFGTGTGDLEKLVVVSPSNEVPVVRWKRDRVVVHPREGWRPNTVYRVELLAGIRDLRNNTSKRSAVVTFTTGAPVPTDSLLGRVVDWTSRRASPDALIEAVLQPDSLVYRTTADSTGRFRFHPLPRGEYLVYGVLDQNRNMKRDPRDSFDSLRIAAGRDSVGELWAFRHDSTAPKIKEIIRSDSLSATLTFSQSLDPWVLRIPGDSILVRALPDSTPVKVKALVTQELYDSLFRARPDSAKRDSLHADSLRAKGDTGAARRDTTGARRDSVKARLDTARARIPGVPRQIPGARRRGVTRDTLDLGPFKTRPPLFEKMILRSEEPFRDGRKYLVEVRGLKSVSGVIGDARITLIVPEAPKRDSVKARADSLKAAADTARKARPDTATKAKPDTTVPPPRRHR